MTDKTGCSGEVSAPNATENAEAGFRELFPFRSRYFYTGRYKLHYVDEGRGPVLLFMHACPFWSFAFRDQIREFSRSHRVVALDQMGFGLSDKPRDYDYRIETHVENLEMFVKTLGLKDITLLMHGRGSTIGMGFAVRHPESIRAFITLNAMAFSNFSLPLRLQICRIKWLGSKIVMKLNMFTRGAHHLPDAVRRAYEKPFPDDASRIALLRFIEDLPCVPEDDSALSMFEIESALWQLRDKPASIAWAEKDWLYTRKSFQKWIQYFPNAEVHVVENAGRYFSEDAPVELTEIIRDFLIRHRC